MFLSHSLLTRLQEVTVLRKPVAELRPLPPLLPWNSLGRARSGHCRPRRPGILSPAGGQVGRTCPIMFSASSALHKCHREQQDPSHARTHSVSHSIPQPQAKLTCRPRVAAQGVGPGCRAIGKSSPSTACSAGVPPRLSPAVPGQAPSARLREDGLARFLFLLVVSPQIPLMPRGGRHRLPSAALRPLTDF